MALKMTMGQYYPKRSLVHELDPRTKVIIMIALVISCFFVRNIPQLVLGYAFVIVASRLSRVPAGKVLGSVRPLLVMFGILSLLNLFVHTGGTPLLSLGALTITTDGVWAAVLYTLRLVIAVVACALLLFTTTPTSLADAFDALLSPLTHVGVPAHELAMVFSLMLRFIPTLGTEAQAIMDAQTARGGALSEGSFAHRVKSVGPVLVALFASSMRHANGLARALDARCYENGSARTHWHPLKMRRNDWLALAACGAYLVFLFVLA